MSTISLRTVTHCLPDAWRTPATKGSPLPRHCSDHTFQCTGAGWGKLWVVRACQRSCNDCLSSTEHRVHRRVCRLPCRGSTRILTVLCNRQRIQLGSSSVPVPFWSKIAFRQTEG